MNMYISVFVLAGIVSLAGYFWLAIVAFKRSVPWGLLVLLLSPITAIVYSLVHWFEARKAFLVYIVSFVLCAGSAVLISGDVGVGNMQQIAARIHSGQLAPAKAYQLIVKALGHPGAAASDLFAEEVAPVSATAGLDQPDAGLAKPLPANATTTVEHAPVQLAADTSKSRTKAKTAPKPVVTSANDAAKAGSMPEQTASNDKQNAKQDTKTQTQQPQQNTNTDQAGPEDGIPDFNKVKPDPLAQKPKKSEPKTVRVRLDKMHSYIGHYFIIKLKSGNEQRGLLRKVSNSYLILDRKLYGGNFQYKIRNSQIKSIHMLTRLPDER